MSHNFKDITISLAGIFQACFLVQQVARNGMHDMEPYQASISSLFNLDPKNTESVFGNVAGVSKGLEILVDQFSENRKKRNMELTQYVIASMHLERKLTKQPALLQAIGNGIKKANNQVDHFSITHENVIANLAGIYTDTISTLTPRIIVMGEQGFLSNQVNANKVRALLLAAIRSAVLWQQCGGRRLQLLFKRGKVATEASTLLKSLSH
ncbi:MAG: high frequency lysogenization protein HflD [Gammaproteobacteria bacterium]